MIRLALFILTFSTLYSLTAQEAGFPFIRNYTPKEYGAEPQAFAVLQDKNTGIMYFGVAGVGIVSYDGVRWTHIPTPNKSSARSIAQDEKGNIFAGASGEFGILKAGSNGKTVFMSLTNLLPDPLIKVGTVHSVKTAGGAAYFQSPDNIYRYMPGEKQVQVFSADTNGVFAGDFVFEGAYHVRLPKKGLMKIDGKGMTPAPGNDYFKGKNPFREAVSFDDRNVLIATRSDGLYLFNPSGSAQPAVFNVSDTGFFADNTLYSIQKTVGGSFVLGSLKKGALIMDGQGKTVSRFDESMGLQNNGVYSTHGRAGQPIWLGLAKGISKTRRGAEWGYRDAKAGAGFNGTIMAVIRTSEGVFIASDENIQTLGEAGKPVEVAGIGAGQKWGFMEHRGAVLAGTASGVFRIKGGKAEHIYKGGHAFALTASRSNPDRIYTTDGNQDFISLLYENGKWTSGGAWAGIKDNIRCVAEDDNGVLWLGTFGNGIIKAIPSKDNPGQPSKVQAYKEKDGLPSLSGCKPYWFGGKLLAGTEKGLYAYDAKTDRFEPYCGLGELFCNGKQGVANFEAIQNGKVYMTAGNNKQSDVGFLKPDGKGGYAWVYKPFRALPEMASIESIYAEEDGKFWVCGSEGVFCYDEKADSTDYGQGFHCWVREVTNADDSLLYAGGAPVSYPLAEAGKTNAGTSPETPSIGYAHNSLLFKFAAPFFEEEHRTRYSYMLEGFDEHWSEWSLHTEKEYTNLWEGTYVFKVKAKNIYDKESSTATFQIEILPPLHRTWWAYVIYIFIAGFVVAGIVRRNTVRLMAEKIRLEGLVGERTAEVMQQNKNIKLLSDIGRELTASLNLEHILTTLYGHINAMMDASVFGIGLYDAKNEIIDYQMAIELGKRYKPYSRDMKDKNQFAVWCIEHKKEVFVNDVDTEYENYLKKTESAESPELEDGAENNIPQGLMYVPLLVKNEVIGLICVQSFKKNIYSQQDLDHLRNIANYASIAIENSTAYLKIAAQQSELADANNGLNQANEELHQQQEELVMLNESLEHQKKTVESTYEQLKITTDQLEKSIQYASHIQGVVMPEFSELRTYFSDVFAVFKPKDVVSGDFYWFSKVDERKSVFALADCTGHGVPGAFMSMLACTLLHEIVNIKKVQEDPARVFRNLHSALQKILKQAEGKNDDGLDISICCFEKIESGEVKFIFAGAKSKMFYIIGNQLTELQGDKQFLGGRSRLAKNFTNQEFTVPASTRFYLFSDGFADQNNAERKKIGTIRFKELILEVSSFTFPEQQARLEQALLRHQGSETQRDDISLVGLKL